jgi:hypothetical protein
MRSRIFATFLWALALLTHQPSFLFFSRRKTSFSHTVLPLFFFFLPLFLCVLYFTCRSYLGQPAGWAPCRAPDKRHTPSIVRQNKIKTELKKSHGNQDTYQKKKKKKKRDLGETTCNRSRNQQDKKKGRKGEK